MKRNEVKIEGNYIIYHHIDHDHVIPIDPLVLDLPQHEPKPNQDPIVNHNDTKPEPFNREKRIEKLIAKYHLDRNAIKIDGNYIIYTHNDHLHSIPIDPAEEDRINQEKFDKYAKEIVNPC